MSKKANPMTPGAARRIQSSQAKKSGGVTKKGSFTARPQRTANKRGK